MQRNAAPPGQQHAVASLQRPGVKIPVADPEARVVEQLDPRGEHRAGDVEPASSAERQGRGWSAAEPPARATCAVSIRLSAHQLQERAPDRVPPRRLPGRSYLPGFEQVACARLEAVVGDRLDHPGHQHHAAVRHERIAGSRLP